MANPSQIDSLTSYLLSIHQDAHRSATQHPFLVKAGKGTLPAARLCEWLVQDKYYQLAYVNFIGSLLAKLDLSSCLIPSQSTKRDGLDLSWTTLNLLVDSLTSIREEINFYDKIAHKYELRLVEAPPNRTTTEYIQLFAAASAKEAPMLHGLLVLWATEHCYHRAWGYASSKAKDTTIEPHSSADDDDSVDGAIAALYNEFIPNWTSVPFGAFVKHLASVTDAWAIKLDVGDYSVCEDLWLRVLLLEADFWPDV